MLWIEGPLSYLEQLCMVSFRDAGHAVRLYHYGPVSNVPDGVELADARDVLPQTDVLTHTRTGSPAPHADRFRYHMLAQHDGMIWADTDAYCLRPFATATGHFHGWESETHVNNGVLGLPRDSATLRELIAFTDDPHAIPDWFSDTLKAELRTAQAHGEPRHAGEMSWGVWGPQALTHFLRKTGEVRHSLPRHALYPFSFRQRRMMLKPGLDTAPYILPGTFSIHFYGRRMRKRLIEKEPGGVPHPDSLMGRLLAKHGIDPAAAPIPRPAGTDAPPAPADAPAPPRRGGRLTRLADARGLDRGSAKHRFTELYDMLFQPYRRRAVKFLELAPLPAGGLPPSAGMWLEYFPRGRIFALDGPGGEVAGHPRLRVLRADPDRRESLAAALGGEKGFDIVIDDASHASHHQQIAFLEIFPRLKPGGLYLVEDLRWQPGGLERKGFTRTADLFASYLAEGRFHHADPEIAAAFDALRGDISGVFLHQAKYIRTNRDQIAVIHKR